MKQILIVDDSSLTRYALFSRLSLEGFRVDVCGTGRRAVELIYETHPNIVLLDMNMPDGDGLFVLENARPSICGYKCILVSSLGRYDDKIVRGLALGAIDHIEKPDIRSLDVVISRIISILKLDDVSVYTGGVLENIVLIIGSTGAPSIIDSVFNLLERPKNTAIILVQHLSPKLSDAYVNYLNKKFPSVLADKVKVDPGKIYFVPGGCYGDYSFTHMIVARGADGHPGDSTAKSIVKNFYGNATVIILSGMGNDGAHAVELFTARGWAAYAQKMRTCVVDSMPQAAIAKGAKEIYPGEIPQIIMCSDAEIEP